MKRSFRSLSVREVLELAISLEDANAEKFEELALSYKDHLPEVTVIFKELAIEEREHGRLMRERFRERFGEIRPTERAFEVYQGIELPEVISTDQAILERMRPIDAYRIAQQAEERAIAFYQQASESTSDLSLRKFYQEFVEIEKEHLRIIKNRIRSLYGFK